MTTGKASRTASLERFIEKRMLIDDYVAVRSNIGMFQFCTDQPRPSGPFLRSCIHPHVLAHGEICFMHSQNPSIQNDADYAANEATRLRQMLMGPP